jgi:hypothetical protein
MVLPYYFDNPQRFPFLHDHFNRCEFTEACRQRRMITGTEVPAFLYKSNFWQLYKATLQLLDTLEVTSRAYHDQISAAQSPCYDSAEYQRYQAALAQRKSELPRLLQSIRALTAEDYDPYGRRPAIPEQSEPQDDDTGPCCTVS